MAKVRSFFDPNGHAEATSADQLNASIAGRNQAAAQQADILRAQLQDAAAQRALALQMGGSFQDKTAAANQSQMAAITGQKDIQGLANAGSLANTQAGVAPQMARVGLERDQYTDTRADTAPQRELANAYSGAELGLVRRAFGDQGPAAAVASPGGMPGQPSAAVTAQPMNQDQALQHLLQLKNPQAYFDSQRRAEDRQQADIERRAAPLRQAQEIAFKSGNVEVGLKIGKQIDALYGGAPTDYSGVGEAYKPTAAEAEAQGTANATAAAEGFGFRNSIAEIDALAKDFRNGRAGKDEVLQKANELVSRLVERKIPEPQAKQMVGEQLDKTLPGLGRDVLSGISATAAALFTPTHKILTDPGAFAEPYRNVGNASALRGDLKSAGFIR